MLHVPGHSAFGKPWQPPLLRSAKYKLNVKIIVLKNNSLGQIKWEQMAFLGNPEYGCDLQPIDYPSVAQACGVRGYSIVDPNQCQDVLAEAFAEQGPTLIEATVDPNAPPLPPKVSFEQARHMIEALVRGTPDGAKIAKQLAKDTIRQLI